MSSSIHLPDSSWDFRVQILVLPNRKGFTDSNCMYDFQNRLTCSRNNVTMLNWLEKPCKYDLPFEKLASIPTDGAKAMTGNTKGIIARISQKLQELHPN